MSFYLLLYCYYKNVMSYMKPPLLNTAALYNSLVLHPSLWPLAVGAMLTPVQPRPKTQLHQRSSKTNFESQNFFERSPLNVCVLTIPQLKNGTTERCLALAAVQRERDRETEQLQTGCCVGAGSPRRLEEKAAWVWNFNRDSKGEKHWQI